MNSENIQIRGLRDENELKIVNELAWKIFPQTYRELLSAEQIPYMMKMMYDLPVLQREYAGNVRFALICDGELPVGYISYHPVETEGVPALKLEKLYLDFAYHGRSVGNMALEYVCRLAKREGFGAVLLNVNKENLRAQRAYTRAGFYRWRSEKNPIGSGFFMDDYVMRYDISAQCGTK